MIVINNFYLKNRRRSIERRKYGEINRTVAGRKPSPSPVNHGKSFGKNGVTCDFLELIAPA